MPTRADGGVPAAVNLAEKFAGFSEHWSPRIVAGLNGQHVKLAKLHGEFIWHRHELEDELFLVVRGHLVLEFRDAAAPGGIRRADVRAGEFIVVPRAVEHRPVATEEVHVVLFEPAGTVNTGSAGGARTVAQPAWI